MPEPWEDGYEPRPLRSVEDEETRVAMKQWASPIYTGVACPKCGEELYQWEPTLWRSEPPERKVECSKCPHTMALLAEAPE